MALPCLHALACVDLNKWPEGRNHEAGCQLSSLVQAGFAQRIMQTIRILIGPE